MKGSKHVLNYDITLMYPHVIEPLNFSGVKTGGYKANELIVFGSATSDGKSKINAIRKSNLCEEILSSFTSNTGDDSGRVMKNHIIKPERVVRDNPWFIPAGVNRGRINPPALEATEVMPSSMKRSRAIEDDGEELIEHTSRLGVTNDRRILNRKAC
jgi:hypothetical protein